MDLPKYRSPPPRRPFSARKDRQAGRLHRELYGGRFCLPIRSAAALRIPRAPDPVPAYVHTDLNHIPIAALKDSHLLRDYIILGEKPTYPYHLITLPKPSTIINTSTNPFIAPYLLHTTSSAITTWSLSAPLCNAISIVNQTEHAPLGARASIRSVFTAWEIPNNRVVQVLTWRHYHPSNLQVSASLELRYGAQICTITELPETPVTVCFGDVTGERTSAVKILVPEALYIYEPFIPTEPGEVKETGCWKHPDLVSVAYEASYAGPQETPRLRMLSLEKLATTCLLGCRLKQLFALPNRMPVFENHYAAFIPTHRPVRTKPGSIQPRAITVLAFGATELVSKMYHIFLFSLSLPCPTSSTSHPRITVVKAKALTSNDTFSWSSMEKSSAYELFRRALTQLGINTRRVPESGHDCEEDCWGGGDDVCILKRYIGGEFLAEESLKSLLLKENRVVLEGWGKEV